MTATTAAAASRGSEFALPAMVCMSGTTGSPVKASGAVSVSEFSLIGACTCAGAEDASASLGWPPFFSATLSPCSFVAAGSAAAALLRARRGFVPVVARGARRRAGFFGSSSVAGGWVSVGSVISKFAGVFVGNAHGGGSKVLLAPERIYRSVNQTGSFFSDKERKKFLGGQLREDFLGRVKIRIHVLHVVVVFEGVAQPDHLRCHFFFVYRHGRVRQKS